MIFRTAAQKADQQWSWNRRNRAFFAAGACHVLVYHFLKSADGEGFRPIMIIPEAGFRGGHVFASDGIIALDYHGYSSHQRLIAHYFTKIRRFFPDWRGSVVDISDTFWTDEWFTTHRHRRPSQFLRDPAERAVRFIQKQRKLNRLPDILKNGIE